MYVLFYNSASWCIYGFVYIYLSFDNFCFGGLVIYKIVTLFLIFNIFYEFIEILFPIKKMRGLIRSFVLIVFLYVMLESLFSLI